jgi:hypothetical protein
LGAARHSRRPHQRRRGTGIWPDRDIAAGWRDIETPRASLPTRSPSRPHTPARKAGVLDLRKRMRARDGLSAGGRRIRTIGPSHKTRCSFPAERAMPREGSGLNRSVRSAPLSLAANRATRATTELNVAGGPKVRIHFPPALSHVLASGPSCLEVDALRAARPSGHVPGPQFLGLGRRRPNRRG